MKSHHILIIFLFIQIILGYNQQKQINHPTLTSVPRKTISSKSPEKVIPARYKAAKNKLKYEPNLVKHVANFPQVEYLTDITEITKPFYYKSFDSNTFLSAFPNDVKSSFQTIMTRANTQAPKMGINDYSDLIQLIKTIKTNDNENKAVCNTNNLSKLVEICCDESPTNVPNQVFVDTEFVLQSNCSIEDINEDTDVVTIVDSNDESIDTTDYAVLEEPLIFSEDQCSELISEDDEAGNDFTDMSTNNTTDIGAAPLVLEELTEEQIVIPLLLEKYEEIDEILDIDVLESNVETNDILNGNGCDVSRPAVVPVKKIILPKLPNILTFKNGVIQRKNKLNCF